MFPTKVLLLIVALCAIAYGQRESSLQVIETMKRLNPLQKELQDFVVSQLTNARLNSSSLVYQLQTHVIETKEKFVMAAIDEEQTVLSQITAQPDTVNPSCLGFIRSGTDMNVNLAGVSYTHCINHVDDSFNETVSRYRDTLHGDEAQFNTLGLFDIFEGENIFYDPKSIIEKLNARLEKLNSDPAFIVDQLYDQILEFEAELRALSSRYEQCLDEGMKLLYTALDLARTQIVQICKGQLITITTTIPETTTAAVTNTTGMTTNTSPSTIIIN